MRFLTPLSHAGAPTPTTSGFRVCARRFRGTAPWPSVGDASKARTQKQRRGATATATAVAHTKPKTGRVNIARRTGPKPYAAAFQHRLSHDHRKRVVGLLRGVRTPPPRLKIKAAHEAAPQASHQHGAPRHQQPAQRHDTCSCSSSMAAISASVGCPPGSLRESSSTLWSCAASSSVSPSCCQIR